MQINRSYELFFEFVNKYKSVDLTLINDQEPFMKNLNELLDRNHQFFFAGDLINYQILYTSPQIREMHGVSPENFDSAYLIKRVHPDDIKRLSRGRTKQMETAQTFYINKEGSAFLSSNFRIKNIDGKYIHILVQCYIFYCKPPIDTTYLFHLETPIEQFTDLKNGRYHWYFGTDKAYFRYPDADLLRTGSHYSNRELEIMTHIHEGLETKEIGERLFLSSYTISTHRRNILKKSGKSNIFEVIFELKNIGII